MPEDYGNYILSKRERRDWYIIAGLCGIILGWLYYRSIVVCVLLAFLSVPLEKYYRRFLAGKRRKKLLEGFRDFLYSVSASAAAGLSMPGAVEAAASELEASFGAESDIAGELYSISSKYRESHTEMGPEFERLAKRSGLKEIAQFASSWNVCAENGGDMESVCVKSASLLLDKLDFAEEVNALIAEKKLDIVILSAMPPGMLFFLNMSTDDYIEALYISSSGRVIMTVCLLMMAVSVCLGLKIINIKL